MPTNYDDADTCPGCGERLADLPDEPMYTSDGEAYCSICLPDEDGENDEED